MPINTLTASPKCNLNPSYALTTCMALHCAINGIGASSESVVTASLSKHQGDNTARKKRSPVEKKPNKTKINSPKERKATAREKKIAAKVVGGLISRDLNFQDIEYINMMIYNKFSTENSASDAGNHYAVKANYKGEDIVIDITAAQFDSLNSPREGIINTYQNWQAKYQHGFSPNTKLVKIHKAKTLSNSHFTVIGRNPFEEIKKEGVEVLTDATWYSQTGINQILALQKQRRERPRQPK